MPEKRLKRLTALIRTLFYFGFFVMIISNKALAMY
jgi:hypothetical protein